MQFGSIVNFDSSRSQLIFVALPSDPPVCYDLSGKRSNSPMLETDQLISNSFIKKRRSNWLSTSIVLRFSRFCNKSSKEYCFKHERFQCFLDVLIKVQVLITGEDGKTLPAASEQF